MVPTFYATLAVWCPHQSSSECRIVKQVDILKGNMKGKTRALDLPQFLFPALSTWQFPICLRFILGLYQNWQGVYEMKYLVMMIKLKLRCLCFPSVSQHSSKTFLTITTVAKVALHKELHQTIAATQSLTCPLRLLPSVNLFPVRYCFIALNIWKSEEVKSGLWGGWGRSESLLHIFLEQSLATFTVWD